MFLTGLHHFYLGNYAQGVLFLVTFGVYGIGWLIDFFRLPSLVAMSNTPEENRPIANSQTVAYLYAISPLGIFGAHHFYLGRRKWGLLYASTMGIFGIGWLVDFFRIPTLVHRENRILRDEESHERKFIDDVYLLWIFFGFFGVHHYYLGRKSFALIYLCSFGLLGFGWFVDFFRIPCLVFGKNNHLDNEVQYVDSQTDNNEQTFVSAIYKEEPVNDDEFDKKELLMIAQWLRQNARGQDLSYFLTHSQAIQSYNHDKSRYKRSIDDTEVYKYQQHLQQQEHTVSRSKSSVSAKAGKLGPKPSFKFKKTPVRRFREEDLFDSPQPSPQTPRKRPVKRKRSMPTGSPKSETRVHARRSVSTRSAHHRRPSERISSSDEEDDEHAFTPRTTRGIAMHVSMDTGMIIDFFANCVDNVMSKIRRLNRSFSGHSGISIEVYGPNVIIYSIKSRKY